MTIDSNPQPDTPNGHEPTSLYVEQGGDLNRPDGIFVGNSLGDDHGNDADRTKPSNEKLLATAFVSFLSFALLQMCFAFIADSDAMKGDSAAMIVDSLTYLFNFVAERRKRNFPWDIPTSDSSNGPSPVSLQPSRKQRRDFRKMELQMEVFPPLLSVLTLVSVTIVVFHSAISTLSDIRKNRSGTEDPNMKLMLGFSTFNMALDILNVFCFAKARHLLGYSTNVQHRHNPNHRCARDASEAVMDDEVKRSTDVCFTSVPDESRQVDNHLQPDQESTVAPSHGGTITISESSNLDSDWNGIHADYDDDDNDDDDERANLNMCSAYTHVFADTLRSIAVILAVCIAEVTPGVTAAQADATAAILVSILILLSLIPLVRGMYVSAQELYEIIELERSEAMQSQERLEATIA